MGERHVGHRGERHSRKSPALEDTGLSQNSARNEACVQAQGT